MIEVRHAGGAIQRQDAGTIIFGSRDTQLLLFLVGVTPSAEAHQQLVTYTDQLKEALRPVLTGGVYIPAQITWAHEQVSGVTAAGDNILQPLDHFATPVRHS